ncbi:hypothetical protein NA57DRAFT_58361 [Rhizodiscina lignyota]|uniref:Uncharacterized protein n=1 Tax=Rhizodiscina lignyota TaxID=1504668 RepID=A0A9P4M379_9PEZI|nr:hypothetical protein NA57DRAFT_58361 [Rhizodiscina lignyota]
MDPPPYSGVDMKELEKEPKPDYTEYPEEAHANQGMIAESSSSMSPKGPKLADLFVDSSKPLAPNRVFWVPWFTLFGKTIEVFDMTAHMQGHWQGAVNKEYRELCKAMYEKYKTSEQPCYVTQARDTLRHHYRFCNASGDELVEWDHGWHSLRDVHLMFPKDSKHSSHQVDVIKANKVFTRDRVFTVNGTMFSVEMDHTWRNNQFTLYKIVGNQKVVVGRYGMKFGGAWFVGGTFALDSTQVDEPIAILACLIIIKQNKQRAAERSGGGGGGGGGGA